MMLRALVLSALLLDSVALTAQLGPQAATPAPRTWVMQPIFVDSGPVAVCPVQMRAQMHGDPTLEQAAPGSRSHVPQPSLHLVLSHAKSEQVVSLELTVEGFTGTPRLVETRTTGSAAPDLAQAFHVALAPESDTDTAANLLLKGYAAVRAIRIDAITYADGRVVKIAPQSSCRFAPDLLVPVSARD